MGEDTFALWPGGPVMDCAGAAPVSTDSVLLANFVNLAGVSKAADFGSGSGLIAIIMASRSPRLRVDCVEISPEACDCARRNIARGGMEGRLSVMEADLRRLRETDVGKYKLIVSNPPYFPLGRGTPSPDDARGGARDERSCTLGELAASAARLLGDGGRFALCFPVQRLAENFSLLSAAGLEPKRLRLVQAQLDAPPSIALAECVRRGRPGLRVEPVLIIKNSDGTDTDEIKRIYRLER